VLLPVTRRGIAAVAHRYLASKRPASVELPLPCAWSADPIVRRSQGIRTNALNGEVRTSNRPEGFPALTGLRFLAALSVLLGHATGGILHFGDGEVGWSILLKTLTGIGMPLFFVLSGFVIHYNYHRSIIDNPVRGVYNFLVARFARLYPLFIVVVCYALFSGGYFENLNNPAVASPLYAALPSYLALVQSWYYRVIGDHTLTFVLPAMTQVTWSISTEWFFYLVYPFACIALAKLRRPGPIILATAMVVAAGYASVYGCAANLDAIDSYGVEHYGAIASPGGAEEFQDWLLYLSPYPHLFEFALGCLAAALLVAVWDRPWMVLCGEAS
jgi:peptidoglycan/LPS O-acetylase OafA/YrhL